MTTRLVDLCCGDRDYKPLVARLVVIISSNQQQSVTIVSCTCLEPEQATCARSSPALRQSLRQSSQPSDLRTTVGPRGHLWVGFELRSWRRAWRSGCTVTVTRLTAGCRREGRRPEKRVEHGWRRCDGEAAAAPWCSPSNALWPLAMERMRCSRRRVGHVWGSGRDAVEKVPASVWWS